MNRNALEFDSMLCERRESEVKYHQVNDFYCRTCFFSLSHKYMVDVNGINPSDNKLYIYRKKMCQNTTTHGKINNASQ